MRWISRPMTRLVGATVFAAMVTGMTLPSAMASSARHSAQATCTATGTYAVGQSTPKHEDSNAAGMMAMMPGGGGTTITGTIVLASYTTCGTATAGTFSVTVTRVKVQSQSLGKHVEDGNAVAAGNKHFANVSAAGDHNQGGNQNEDQGKNKSQSHGKNKGGSDSLPLLSGTGVVTPTGTVTSTTTVTATGTFAQDPTRASNPGAVVVSGTVTITSTGALCTPAAATQQNKSHAASLLQGRTQTVHIATADCSAPGTSGAGAPITFANVRGRLKIKTDGTSSWASLSFIVKPGTPTTGKHHENEGIPVTLTGLRTTP